MPISQNGSPVVGGVTTGDTSLLASRTFPANMLVLVAIAMRDETITVSGVALNGNNFTQIANIDNTQGQGGIEVWRAMFGSEQTGQITITHTGNTLPVSVVAQAFDGVDTSGTNGSGAIEANVNDPGPAVDNNDAKVDVTTLTANAWVVGMLWHRGVVFTTPVGENTISINNEFGAGGDRARASMWYEGPIASPSTVTIGALDDLASDSDWAIVGVAVKLAGGTQYTQSAAGTQTWAGALLAQGQKTLAGVQSFAGAISVQVSTAKSGVLSWVGALVNQVNKTFAGELSFAGVLATIKITLKGIEGSQSFAGALLRQANKIVAGSQSFVGTLLTQGQKTLAGVQSFAGVLATIKTALKSVEGSQSFAGALLRQANKIIAGSQSFVGVLVRDINKSLSGGITPAGVLAAAKQALKSIAGILSFGGVTATEYTPAPGEEPGGGMAQHISNPAGKRRKRSRVYYYWIDEKGNTHIL